MRSLDTRIPRFSGASAAHSGGSVAFFVAFVLATCVGMARASEPALVVRHVLDVSLDPRVNGLVARDSVFIPPDVAKGGALRFLLHRGIEVSAARIDGQPMACDARDGWDPRHFWERPPYAELAGYDVAREWTILLPGAAPKDTTVLFLKYGGTIAGELLPPDSPYGRGFESTSGRVVNQGAYLSGATFWTPWFGDHFSTFSLTANVPGNWLSVSQGRLDTKESNDSERRVQKWTSVEPMKEIYLIAGPYRMREIDHRGVRVMTFCYENTDSTITDRYLAGTGRYLDEYGARFGAYPFSKFALVENYWQSGYGMPSFTLLGDLVIRLPFILDTSYGHEILHNWWGNGVFVREEGGNWCEGLTTYCADYAAKEKQGAAAAEDSRREALLGYRDFAAKGGKDFPLVNFRERDSAATQAVGYGKTMMVFHMMRKKLGDEKFDAALRGFYRENLFREAGWEDLRRAFETEGGADFTSWFAQWLERDGAPRLTVEEVREDRGKRVKGVLVQEEPAYDLDVPLRLVAGKDTTFATIACRGPRTEFSLPAKGRAQELAVDPGCDVFRFLHDGEVAVALSGVLGATSTRFVIGKDADAAAREAMRAVAREWAGDSTVALVEEEAVRTSGDNFTGATWILGDGPRARELKAAVPAGTSFDGVAGSLVFVSPGVGGAGPVAVYLPESAAHTVEIARKVPHYSKYGYLAFDGTKNAVKGTWPPGDSPLRIRLEERKDK